MTDELFKRFNALRAPSTPVASHAREVVEGTTEGVAKTLADTVDEDEMDDDEVCAGMSKLSDRSKPSSLLFHWVRKLRLSHGRVILNGKLEEFYVKRSARTTTGTKRRSTSTRSKGKMTL
jgi:hypothetical protein